MATMNLKAEVRNGKGKNSCNRLRSAGFIPAIVYSHGESEAVKVNARDFNKLFKGQISESVIIELDVSGKEVYQVYVKDYQKHPVTDHIQHVDLFKVTKGEKIKTHIKVEVIGNAVGVRKGGVFELIERELEIEVLPIELPEKLEIDVTNLEIGDSLYVKDIQGPASMTFIYDDDHVVAHVVGARAEEEIEGEEAEEEAQAEAETEE
jgi:large subunit ribosomal protein L25